MSQNIKFGPAGLGPVKTAIKRLEEYALLGIKACEIAFTYGIYIKELEAIEIGKKAKELGIQLSIHAPYWINLNSVDSDKIEKSKQRIINCLKIGTLLNAKYVVFHPGYYGKDSKEKTYEIIKKQIIELQEIKKKKSYTPKLAPETMGKINVFGSIEEISRLVRDTRCHACIDFAHIYARYGGSYKFEETFKLFENLEELHIHFSGIEYGEKGEKKHLITPEKELKLLIKKVKEKFSNKSLVVINESPSPIEDSIRAIKISKNKI